MAITHQARNEITITFLWGVFLTILTGYEMKGQKAMIVLNSVVFVEMDMRTSW